jgi:xanthine dehydrogenase accessory factor
MPLAVHRLLARARGQGILPPARVVQGWFLEPVTRGEREIWIWGAGHVGRALVAVLQPLPGFRITWLDVSSDRFPPLPEGVEARIFTNPADLMAQAPKTGEHLVLTFSHALDLEICHQALGHGFATLGLIGSATKWARFRSRLAALGHTPATIDKITCPIGDPSLGKHPQAIAIGVAAQMMKKTGRMAVGEDSAGHAAAPGERAK